MKTLYVLIKRNTRLFFKDKAMFFTSLITPGILLVLYSTFLGKVYRDSFWLIMPKGFDISDQLADGFVNSQITSSILAVSCVTVAFCSNMIMVRDKANGCLKDLMISPVKRSTLAFSYYLSSLLSTFIVCFVATGLCLVYIAVTGWYMTVKDVLLILLDVSLLAMFGTALSSIINFFLSTFGQISAVNTIVSSGYGFICGAYMPISNFSDGLQHIISFLPGTYATSLVRNHAMNGVFREMKNIGIPKEIIDGVKEGIDCKLYFYDHPVDMHIMYIILCSTIIALIAIYILINYLKKKPY